MYLGKRASNIPGTVLERESMGNVTGMEFLGKIYYITDGIMLAQIREISAVDGSTLQNWVKRGWVVNPKNKRYSIDSFARILIINMIRGTMQLSRISFLLRFINGDPNSREDDIIPESRLYDYICRIVDTITDEKDGEQNLITVIENCTSDYKERVKGDKKRLNLALEVIVTSYYASLVKDTADAMMSKLESNDF